MPTEVIFRMTSEVLRVVIVMVTVLWDVTPWNLVDISIFMVGRPEDVECRLQIPAKS
jgi:hypothetical protein